MATFTALVKNFSTNFFCNQYKGKLGLLKVLSSEISHIYTVLLYHIKCSAHLICITAGHQSTITVSLNSAWNYNKTNSSWHGWFYSMVAFEAPLLTHSPPPFLSPLYTQNIINKNFMCCLLVSTSDNYVVESISSEVCYDERCQWLTDGPHRGRYCAIITRQQHKHTPTNNQYVVL